MTAQDMTAQKLVNAFNKAAAARYEYEIDKSAESAAAKVARYCALDLKEKKTKLSKAFFQKLIDANIATDFTFLNNSVRDTNRFNVYAIEKAMLNLRSIAQDSLIKKANKYDIACVLHCIRNKDKESFAFNRKDALAMLSLACQYENFSRSDAQITFNVQASTASTQVSSSFRMLEALDILRFDESASDRQIVSNVNYEHAFVQLVAKEYNLTL